RTRVAPFPFVVGRFTAGDFDGDGILDLAEPISTNQLSILRGAGDGSFSIAQTLTIGTPSLPFNPVVPRSADLNGDGIDDLAISNSGDGQIGIVLGRPGGGWSVSYVPAFAPLGGALQV